MKFPKHECSLTLEHNGYKDYYETIEQAHESESYNNLTSWKNDEDKKLSLETGEIWVLQWYPDTPIGFHRLAGATLEGLLTFANEVEELNKDRE